MVEEKKKKRLGVPLCQSSWVLISQEKISHGSDNFSDLLGGETGAKTMMMGHRQSGTA